MMPPHNLATIAPQRTLPAILADLKHARRDWLDALAAAGKPDAEDRANEADQRIDDLRAEFAERFEMATGLTWKAIASAVAEAIL